MSRARKIVAATAALSSVLGIGLTAQAAQAASTGNDPTELRLPSDPEAPTGPAFGVLVAVGIGARAMAETGAVMPTFSGDEMAAEQIRAPDFAGGNQVVLHWQGDEEY